MSSGIGEDFVYLEACSDFDCRTVIIPFSLLLVVWEKFEPFEVMCPYAEGSSTDVSADEVMAAVSANCQLGPLVGERRVEMGKRST